MKIMLITFALILSFVAHGQDAEQYKALALKSCADAVQGMPVESRDSIFKSCKCTVEKTDYNELIKAQNAGNTGAVQEIAMAAAVECAKEVK